MRNTFGCRQNSSISRATASSHDWESRSSECWKPGTHPTVKVCHGRRWCSSPCRAQGWTCNYMSQTPTPSAQSWPEHRIPAMMVAKAGNVRGPLHGPGTPEAIRPAVTLLVLPKITPPLIPCLPGSPHSPHPPSPPQSLTLQHLPPSASTQPCRVYSAARIWLGWDLAGLG